MTGALTLITAPTAEPLSLGEAKSHLRVDGTTDDVLIADLIKAARQDLDARDGRLMGVTLMTQTWELALDGFQTADGDPLARIILPLWPLQSVESIAYSDPNGDPMTLPPTAYRVDTRARPGSVMPAYGGSWPAARDATPNAVVIRFVAGYGSASAVPQFYRHAIKLAVAHLYAHRGEAVAELPPAYFALLGVRGAL